MSLSSDLIYEFVKVTNDATKAKDESTVYATIVEYDGSLYAQLDGSELLTPISTTTDIKAGDRVTVLIKNHTATVTGNTSDPSASGSTVKEMGNKISEFEIVIADKVSAQELDAERGRIDELVTDNVIIKDTLTATKASIDTLEADNVTIKETLTANEASITKLEADIADIDAVSAKDLEAINADIHNLDATFADFESATVESLTAVNAAIEKLDTEKLSAEDLDATFANIDFSNIGTAAIENLYATSGIIKDIIVSEGKITGELVGVTIKGDLIEAGTVVADKLVVKGEDGIYYKLNMEAGVTSSEELTDEELQNGLHGDAIIAQSITATKIAVDDLVAFDATIGGFNITESSLYSGAKSSVGNTTRGIYQDKDGQFAVGDGTNYLKFYKDSSGNYKLAIAADSITMSSSGKTVETAISEVQTNFNNLKIGGRNYALKTATPKTITGANKSNQCQLVYNISTNWQELAGKKVTISFDYEFSEGASRTDGGTENVLSVGLNVANYSKWAYIPVPATAMSGHAVGTRTVPTDVASSTYVGYRADYLDGDVTISNFKMEIGTKETDWTPAPEDVDSAISTAQTTANTAQTKADNAQANIDGLEIGGTNLASLSALTFSSSTASAASHTIDGYTWHITKTTSTSYAGIKIANSVFEVGKTYTLSYKFQKTAGTLEGIGGHCGGFTQLGLTIDGVAKSTNYSTLKTVTDDTEIHEVVFIGTYTGAHTSDNALYVQPNRGKTTELSCDIWDIQVEKGNRATDWSPAPEDVDNQIRQTGSDIYQTIAEQNTAITNSCSEIILEALTSYTQTSDFDTFKASMEAQLKLMADQMSLQFSQATDNLQGVNDELQGQINAITKYFTFDVNGITIGQAESPYKVVIDNDRYSMTVNETEVMYIDNGKMYAPELELTTSLKLMGYSISKDSNGNMNLNYMGGE